MALSGSAFPSPAAEYLEPVLDLTQLIVTHPSATFYARAAIDMQEGVYKDDILVIDRAQKPAIGNLALVIADGDLRLIRITRTIAPITVWGIVSYILHKA